MSNQFYVKATIFILFVFTVLMFATGILSFAAFVSEGNNQDNAFTVSILSVSLGVVALMFMQHLNSEAEIAIDEAIAVRIPA